MASDQHENHQPMYAFINASAGWLNPHIARFLRQHAPDLVVVDDVEQIPPGADTVFQFCDGWELNQNFAVLNAARRGLINAYPSSDAVARKDYLSAVVQYWTAKRPGSVLVGHVPHTVRLTLDYAEYVDEGLAAADDLALLSSLEANEGRDEGEREWWILKPALVDCGAGIRLFSTVDELAGHLELVENETDGEDEDEEDEEAEEEGDGNAGEGAEGGSGGTSPESGAEKDKPCPSFFSPTLSTPGLDTLDALVTTTNALSLSRPRQPAKAIRAKKPSYVFKAGGRIPSAQMRCFVAQRYLHRVALIEGRKWHVRAYVAVVGRLRVYVFREMLTLLAAERYAPPWEDAKRPGGLLRASLTNTALQDAEEVEKGRSMRDFWRDEEAPGEDGGAVPRDLFPQLGDGWKEKLFEQICGVAAELFKAAAYTMADKFTPLNKCFELFALDFLVDADGAAWLLECNETPAFYEQGVAGPMALRLMESLMCLVMEHMGVAEAGDPKNAATRARFVEVLNETEKLGKSNIAEIMPE
ncbi:hypothetical protein VTJ83DRAFT_4490 [Remersonia thermophila]|uniref:Tubulin-tyrosine ligase n=1 Tax=Remersonia thermophila TaxID=72144 RepID=A0ABR4DA42_9PEZI